MMKKPYGSSTAFFYGRKFIAIAQLCIFALKADIETEIYAIEHL
ncbi:hypothetical protein J537_0307 [Acinetobacter baumannii 1437282]|nr:hypothetical protein J537_0307 [Acinetobacter baumannii 1437282]